MASQEKKHMLVATQTDIRSSPIQTPGVVFPILLSFLFFVLSITGVSAEPSVTVEGRMQANYERASRLASSGIASTGSYGQVTLRALETDTDDDGIPDAQELAMGLDPNNPDDAWLDPDGDAVINLFEYQLGGDFNNPATPAVVTVAASGADYTDVATAIDSVTPGTVIRVAAGSYAVNYQSSEPKVVMIQGGWDLSFTQRDLGLYPTIFDGGSIAQKEILYFLAQTGEPVVVLDGIHFINGSGTFGAVNLLATGSAFMRTSVVNCSLTKSTNTFESGGILSTHNWETSTADRTIANTLIADNQASAIYSQNTDESIAHWRIINSTFTHNRNAGGSNGYGIDTFTNQNGKLTAHVYNSIVWGNDQQDFSIRGNMSFDVDHSDTKTVNVASGAIYNVGEGNIEDDPLFADAAGGDFHLSEGSPAIDGGIALGAPASDIEGKLRPDGSGYDMGAYEHELVATPPDTPVSNQSPISGVWKGKLISFYVSGDGSKITSVGSDLRHPDGSEMAVKIGPIRGKAGCRDFTRTAWYTGTFSIVNGRFAAASSDGSVSIKGVFTSQTTSEGTLSHESDGGESCSGNFQISGAWTAQP